MSRNWIVAQMGCRADGISRYWSVAHLKSRANGMSRNWNVAQMRYRAKNVAQMMWTPPINENSTFKTKPRFTECYTCFGRETKTRYVFWLFFKIGLRSTMSFKRSRRELSTDVAENRSILKNKGVVRILVIFQDIPVFSHISQKVSARAFHWCGWT